MNYSADFSLTSVKAFTTTILFLLCFTSLTWAQSAPVNDHFANAQPISGNAGSITGSNVNATREVGEPNHAGSAGARSVWYRWSAPRSGRVGFTTIGSNFDTRLAVYVGDGLNALTVIDSNNDRLGETSIVRFNAVAGRIYHIAVDGLAKPPLSDQGTIKLNWFPAPDNDDFAQARDIRGTTGSISGNTIAAGKQTGEPNHAEQAGGASVWYRWTAPAAGVVTFNTLGSNFDTLLAVYTGNSLNALSAVAGNNDRFERTSSVSFNANGGGSYYIAVDGAGGDFGNLILNWSAVADNDHFANAKLISGNAGSLTGNNSGATEEASEPNHAGNLGGASVWYRWTAPSSGAVTFTTLGSDFNTLLAVYTGSSVSTLSMTAANNDDSRGRTTSIVTFNAVFGRTYSIAVDGFAGTIGNFTLNWFRTPSNDLFVNAQTLMSFSGSMPGSNLAAFREAGEPQHADSTGGASVWYRWTAPASGTVTFSTAGSELKAIVAVYLGSAVNALFPVADGEESATFNVTMGFTYRIAVDGQPDQARNNRAFIGDFTLRWSFVSRPANDNFSSAQLILGGSGSVRGSNALASKQTGEPNHAGRSKGVSVWYRWIAPANGSFVFTTQGSEFSTILAIYTGNAVDALTPIGSDYDREPRRFSLVVVNAVAGASYRIAVDSDSLFPSTNQLRLNWSPVPGNDQFANAQTISGSSGNRADDNIGASKQAGEPNHGGNMGGASVWYRWQAPVTGVFSFNTFGSGFDTLLGVYTGSAVNQLSIIARNDNRLGFESSVTFRAIAGTTYSIAVDGNSGLVGNIALRWFPSSAPTNDNFVNAETLTGTEGRKSGSNLNASREFIEPSHAGQTANSSVWYRWQAPATGSAVFSTLGSDFGTRLAVYTGASLISLTTLASTNQDSPLVFNVTAGTTYQIAVDGRAVSDVDSLQGNLQLSFRMLPLGNDNFAGARQLSGSQGQITDNSLGATKESGEPIHAGRSGGASLWYRWQAPSSGSTTFTTVGSDFDTLLGVYTGAQVNQLLPVAGNDDFVLGTSIVTFNATAGVTYFVAVDGQLGQTGLITLAWNRGAPINDDLGKAVRLSGISGATGSNNANATAEAGEPLHAGAAGGRSIWYRWQAPTNGAVTFSTSGSALDTALAVYTGNSFPTLAAVAGNDDENQTKLTSRVTFQTVAGTTYLIAVDGVGGRAGDIVLKWRVSASISGQVGRRNLDGSLSGTPYAPIILSGAESRTLTADAAGYYSIANLPPNGNYTVTAYVPGRIGGFSRSFSPLKGDLDDIEIEVSTIAPSVNISGKVKNAGGDGLSGILMVLSGSASLTRTSTGSGFYLLPDLPVGGSFVVTPTDPTYSFSPALRRLGNLAGDVFNADFTAGETFTVSGKVTDRNGNPLAGVSIALIGSQYAPVQTDADGNYSFSVPAGGDYTVAPTFGDFVFLPAQLSFANLSQHQKTADFVGEQFFAISGRVTLGANGLAGVQVTLSGGQSGSVMTDADGNYVFPNLPAELSYTVTPTKANFTFAPPSLPFDSLLGNQRADFTAIPPSVVITATDANASESGADAGVFTVARTGSVDAPLTVAYTIGGTATNGLDYDEITNTVTIGAGAASATILVKPKTDALVEGSETVLLTLAGGSDYQIGAQPEATVMLADAESSSPTLRIVSPANGQNFAEAANVTLVAETSPGHGVVGKVEFFSDGNKIGEASSAPYHFVWPAVAAGVYVLTAKTTDNLGGLIASNPVTITVGPEVTSVSAASYRGAFLANGSIVAAFGAKLATETKVASLSSSDAKLPTVEAGSSVKFKDSLGAEWLAPLFSISPTQINYQIPPEAARGTATVTVTINGQVSAVGAVEIAQTEPGLFSADGSGQGLPSAFIQRIKPDGTVTTEPLARFDEEQNRFVAVPIDLGSATDQVFLVLFGTGFRGRSALTEARCLIGGEHAEVLFAGPQGGFVGLDQANILLPRALAGRGEVELLLTVDGKNANPLKIEIK